MLWEFLQACCKLRNWHSLSISDFLGPAKVMGQSGFLGKSFSSLDRFKILHNHKILIVQLILHNSYKLLLTHVICVTILPLTIKRASLLAWRALFSLSTLYLTKCCTIVNKNAWGCKTERSSESSHYSKLLAPIILHSGSYEYN